MRSRRVVGAGARGLRVESEQIRVSGVIGAGGI